MLVVICTAFGIDSISRQAPLLLDAIIGVYDIGSIYITGYSISELVKASRDIKKYTPVIEDVTRINDMGERIRKWI